MGLSKWRAKSSSTIFSLLIFLCAKNKFNEQRMNMKLSSLGLKKHNLWDEEFKKKASQSKQTSF